MCKENNREANGMNKAIPPDTDLEVGEDEVCDIPGVNKKYTFEEALHKVTNTTPWDIPVQEPLNPDLQDGPPAHN